MPSAGGGLSNPEGVSSLLYSSIRPMRSDEGAAVAVIHLNAIAQGFLSSLGPKFLTELYTALPSCPSGFAFVCELGGGPVGFIACADDTRRLFKEILRRRGVRLALAMVPALWKPGVISNSLETLSYPREVGEEMPSPEILSIAVTEGARGRGIGKALMRRAMAAFRGKGIDRVKVAVESGNHHAQHLYRSLGFVLAKEQMHHGRPMSTFTTDAASVPAVPREAGFPPLERQAPRYV